MKRQGVERRLAAILSADAVGYSRLMEADEAGTLAALNAHREELIDPAIAGHHGRIVKLMGDGVLVEFPSVVEAVQCAVDIQRGVAERNETVSQERRIAFRIGVHLGDIIVEDDDIYGDGVNIAARLEGLAEPGGICISRQVFDQVETKLPLGYRDLGARQVKNLARPIHVFEVRFDGEATAPGAPTGDAAGIQQEIRFCTAADGVRIAFATVGEGPPLVKAANWLNHLEYDWRSPVWRHLLQELARDHLLVRYDERGNGLSDWEVDDISFEAFVRDLETVVDAVGLERFALLGISQGCAVSIAYAVRHPERVTHLVLYGGYARGRRRRGSPEGIEQAEAMMTLMRQGWGQENPAFRQMFTSLMVPEATAEQMQWLNDLQRITATPENAVRLRQAFENIDVSDLLPEVAAPTLVLHCRGDAVAPFEEGRRLAAMIPGARLVALEGRNHLILENEPAFPRFVEEIRNFLGNT
ncbi:MAG: alpha/beta fold hydrolase [Proteobacteria bacterium]|nr:alpha/beta fold hydrolase [Pseudomonadota bacterium]